MHLKSSMASKQGSTGNDGDGKRKNRNVETKMEADGQKDVTFISSVSFG